jgi:hypothetical protein
MIELFQPVLILEYATKDTYFHLVSSFKVCKSRNLSP